MTDKLQEIRERLAGIGDGSDEECAVCGESYALRSMAEDTGFCDPCAQDIASNYTSDINYLLSRLLLAEKLAERNGVYMASKTKHADKWKALRSSGVPVICTWIDEAGIGETKDFSDLWIRCISEISHAEVLIAYAETGDELKGGLLEIGAALSAGTPVIVVGDVPQLKTAKHHPLVSFADSVESALSAWEGK